MNLPKVSPEVHVSFQPVADDVGDWATWTAAHDDDDHCLHSLDPKSQWQGKSCERHNAKLAEEANDNAPWLLNVAPQLCSLHSAAHGEHDHCEHDGEHRAHHYSQDGIEVTGRNKAVCARAGCGSIVTDSWQHGGWLQRGHCCCRRRISADP